MDIKEDRDFQIVEKDYGRISRMLEMFWGSDIFPEYVTNILNDTRDGERYGFPKHIFEALSRLLITHDRFFPQFIKEKRDPTQGWFKFY